MQTFRLNGAEMSTIAACYDEFNRVFMVGVDWRFGPSLDALNDVLYGGYGAAAGDEPFVVIWEQHELARAALGVGTTREWLEDKLRAPAGFNRAFIEAQLAALEAGTGQTYFDLLREVFSEHPRVTLRLE